MDEKKEKKKAAYLSGLKAAVGRRASSWSEVSSLKAEIDRKNSEIHLLLQDVENLKTEAGNLAYLHWKEGSLKPEDFDALFGAVRKKEADIEALEASKLVLESQLHYAKTPSEPAKTDREDCPYTCPACGAGYKTAANFCRKCGVRIGENKDQKEEKTEEQQSDITDGQTCDAETSGK